MGFSLLSSHAYFKAQNSLCPVFQPIVYSINSLYTFSALYIGAGFFLQSCLFSMLNAENKISQESHGYIQKAILYLEQHYHESISIPQIADHVGISPIYLTKLFKLSTGKTLSEYLNFYRNQRSLELLVHTNNTINEISAKVGYSDVRSYIRFFKKFYQMTPGKYRQEHANDGIY